MCAQNRPGFSLAAQRHVAYVAHRLLESLSVMLAVLIHLLSSTHGMPMPVKGQVFSKLPQAVLLDYSVTAVQIIRLGLYWQRLAVLLSGCARYTGRPVATSVIRYLLQQHVHRQTLRQPCQVPRSHLICSGCRLCSLHTGTDIRRAGHTLFM